MTTTRILSARDQNKATIQAAAQRLHILGQKYRLTVQDANQLVILALLGGNSVALTDGLSCMTAYSARPPEEELLRTEAFIDEVYGIRPADLRQHPFVDSVLAGFRGRGTTDVDLARLSLDWQAILLIESLYVKDQTVRLMPDRFFRDSSMLAVRSRQYPVSTGTAPGKWMAMEVADSANIEALAGYLRTHPFPGESSTGEHALKLWVILRHGCGLLSTVDTSRMRRYVAQYKFLMPIFHEAARTGEFSQERYAYVHETLMLILRKHADAATVGFFAQLAI